MNFCCLQPQGEPRHDDSVHFWLLGTGKAEGRAEAALEGTTKKSAMLPDDQANSASFKRMHRRSST